MATRPLLTLTEYEPVRGVALATSDAGLLRRLVPTMTVSPSWEHPGRFDLVPGSEVGSVGLDGCDVILRPKIPVDRLLFLVSYALDPARWDARQAIYATAPDLVEGMAALFAHELRLAMRKGVQQGYRPVDDALTTIRGRVRFDEQLRRRLGVELPVEVAYDEYTEDTDLNRVLRAALWRLTRLPIRNDSVRSTLAFCAAVFADSVTLVDYSAQALPSLTWNRLNGHYRPAGELALLILGSTSVEMTAGAPRAAGFVIDMNVVFEEFVRTALREELRVRPSDFPSGDQVALHLDERRRITLRPDLSLWQDGTCRFVGDAKYKRLNVKGVNHPDLYQLLAYVTALDLPAGLLVYAAGEAEQIEHTVVHNGKRLHVTTVNLNGPPADILDEMRLVARQVRELVELGSLVGQVREWSSPRDAAGGVPELHPTRTRSEALDGRRG